MTVCAHGPIAIVSISGELDMATAPQLAACLNALDGDIRIDCSALRFIDSSGLSLFARVHHELETRGRTLWLDGLSAQCRQSFEITRLDELLNLGP